MATELLEPVVEDGVRVTHFFNGRILTAEDLRREQDAARDRHRGLAGAVGEGVVQGLEVRISPRDPSRPAVRVAAGLGFNRDGDPVALPRDVELRLVPAQTRADEEAGLFAVCDRPGLAADITQGGFYLLAARPASTLSREQVPVVDLASEGVGSRCASRYAELGASFSLVPLSLPPASAGQPLANRLSGIAAEAAAQVDLVRGGDTGAALALSLARNLSRLRSGMAHWCAGRDAAGARVVSLAVPPAAPPPPAGPPLEALRAAGALASCDLPLALLFVSRRRLEWVDMWAVRRQPVPRLSPEPLPLLDELPPAEAVAAFMQFRDHAASFLVGDAPAPAGSVQASDWFLFLPPVGVLPLGVGGAAGFTATTFFSGRPVTGPTGVDAARVPPLLRAALQHPSIDLAAQDRAWTYTVSGLPSTGSAPCLLFSSYPLEPDLALPVRITGVVPATGIVTVDGPLRVRGENFRGSLSMPQVTLDGTPVPAAQLDTATDTEVAFEVPAIAGLPEFGRPALLVVSNGATSDFLQLTVQPAPVQVAGELDVEFLLATQAIPLPGQPATFRFTVRNRTNRSGTAALSASVEVNDSETAWQSLLRVLPGAQATSPITGVSLAVGEERSVFVQINPIPVGTPEDTTFSVALGASMGTVAGSSGLQAFTVGEPADVPDPHVTSMTLTNTFPASALQGSTVRVSPYFPVQVVVTMVVNLAATYIVTADFVDTNGEPIPVTGWTISLLNQNGAGEVRLPAGSGVTTLSVQVLLSNYWFSAAIGAEVRVRVRREGQEQVRDLPFSAVWSYYYY
ncbi:MAG TPA: hypothetical protein VFR37_13570 [Longimicrobium sp.]|nr:hypothetical protein [Longimicrobium sp.]